MQNVLLTKCVHTSRSVCFYAHYKSTTRMLFEVEHVLIGTVIKNVSILLFFMSLKLHIWKPKMIYIPLNNLIWLPRSVVCVFTIFNYQYFYWCCVTVILNYYIFVILRYILKYPAAALDWLDLLKYSCYVITLRLLWMGLCSRELEA